MVEGFLLDKGGFAGLHQTRWVSGLPREGIFGNLKPTDAPQFKVVALRCESCGGLDLYARTQAY